MIFFLWLLGSSLHSLVVVQGFSAPRQRQRDLVSLDAASPPNGGHDDDGYYNNNCNCNCPLLSSPMAAFVDDQYVQVTPSTLSLQVDSTPKAKTYVTALDCDVIFDMDRQRQALAALFQEAVAAAARTTTTTTTTVVPNHLQHSSESSSVSTKDMREPTPVVASSSTLLETRIREGPSFQPLSLSNEQTKKQQEQQQQQQNTVSVVASPKHAEMSAEHKHHQPSSLRNGNQARQNEKDKGVAVVVQGGSRVTFRTTMQNDDRIPFETVAQQVLGDNHDEHANGGVQNSVHAKQNNQASRVQQKAYGAPKLANNNNNNNAGIPVNGQARSTNHRETTTNAVHATEKSTSTTTLATTTTSKDDLVVTGVAALALAGLSAVVGVETLVDVAVLGAAAFAMATASSSTKNNHPNDKDGDESLLLASSSSSSSEWNSPSSGNSTEILGVGPVRN